MSETELSVICKNCGSEVSPYVTECPYCGTRLRKRAPKLERRGDALEAQRPRRRRPRLRRRVRSEAARPFRPYATLAVILGSAALLLVQKASGDPLSTFGGLLVPLDDEWWRYLTAPFAYVDVGYLFVVAVALAIFGTGIEWRLGSVPTAVLLFACGALGTLAGGAVADSRLDLTVIAGGNGMALGAVAAWFALRRAEARGAIDEEYDTIGVAVAAAVLIALPLFASTADLVTGLAGGAVGGLAGLAAAAVHRSD
ncbi:MAG TPA: rhomboid family intramembrane serine protease [Solirubrobacterales bacterium]|jgi:membrane associated rhomboid family serine protease|nr:rhomboid family intramembrane serine protease [Solirubrobacterales bacterium]